MRRVLARPVESVDRGGFRLLNAGKIGFSGLLRGVRQYAVLRVAKLGFIEAP